jgi:transcriptional regulator with XRE-family HTH domain
MVNKPGAKSNDPVPQRLRAIRKVQGFEDAKEFAEFLGVSGQRYGNIEAGSSELSKEIAFIIVEKVPGMTLDWLFLKSRDGLNPSLHERLEVAAVQVAEEHRTRLASARRRASSSRRAG